MRKRAIRTGRALHSIPSPELRHDVSAFMVKTGRLSRGLKISQLARELDMSSQHLQQVEQGKVWLTTPQFDALCDALNYPIAFFALELGEQTQAIHDAPEPLFVCDTHAWIDEAYEQAVYEASELGTLRRQVRELKQRLARYEQGEVLS